MFIRVNIAVPCTSHNRRYPRPLEAPLLPRARCCGKFILLGVLTLAGCDAGLRSRTTPIPTWELAEARPARTVPLARVRVPLDHRFSENLIQPLCTEYSLLLIETAKDWEQLQSDIEVPDLPPEADLRMGMIVGLLAEVGEASDAGWPVTLQEARVRNGAGWLIAQFRRGLYYPVKTAAYLELIYVPRMQRVRRVDINNRSFALYLHDELP